MATNPPTRYLLDTNILIHYARGLTLAQYIEATYSLRSISMSPLISIVTVGEVRAFALHRSWGATKLRQLQSLLDQCVIVPLDLVGIVDAYAELDSHNIAVGRKNGRQ